MLQNGMHEGRNDRVTMGSSLERSLYINLKQFILRDQSNFKMIIADKKGFQIVTQLLGQKERLELGIVAIVQLQSLDLLSVLQQNLCNIQIIAHSDSLQQVMEILTTHYQYLNQIQILFIDSKIQKELVDFQTVNIQTQFTVPKGFACMQVNCDCKLINRKIVECDNLQSAIDLFSGPQYFNSVVVVGAFMKQEDDIYLNRIKQIFSQNQIQYNNDIESEQDDAKHVIQQQTTQPSNKMLYIVLEEASIKNSYMLTDNFFSLLTRFYPIINLMLNYYRNTNIYDVMVQHLDDIMIKQNYENVKKALGIPDDQTLNIDINEQIYNILYEQDLLVSIADQAELLRTQLNVLQQKEASILKENNVSQVSQFNEEKDKLLLKMNIQKLILQLIKYYQMDKLIVVFDNLKSGSISTGDQSVKEVLSQQKSQYLSNLLHMYLKCLNSDYQFSAMYEYLQYDYQLISQIKSSYPTSGIGVHLINKIKAQVSQQNQSELGQFIRSNTKSQQLNVQYIREGDQQQELKKTVIFIGQSALKIDFSELVDGSKNSNIVDNIIIVKKAFDQIQ